MLELLKRLENAEIRNKNDREYIRKRLEPIQAYIAMRKDYLVVAQGPVIAYIQREVTWWEERVAAILRK